MKSNHFTPDNIPFEPGMRVRILEGPFKDFRGTITEIDPSLGQAKVSVNFFRREVMADLKYNQIVQERE